MVTIEEAWNRLDGVGSPLESQRVGLDNALHRVAAETVRSALDLPPFAQSAMDGYAIRSADLRDASESSPVELRVVGEIAAGESETLSNVEAGEAVLVNTGGRIPPGADTVVRRERVERRGDDIMIERAITSGKDVRPVGEELERGTVLVESGERLDERHLAALSMTGEGEVTVRRAPSIGVLVSGDEVIPPSAERERGDIYDANTPFLGSLLRRLGYSDLETRWLPDDAERVEELLEWALEEFDLVVSTGGVSVGDRDFLHRKAEQIGVDRVFWQIDQKPGRPVYCGVRDGTPYLGLPGNPGAVFVDAHAYLLRLLDRLEGCDQLRPALWSGRAVDEFVRSAKRPRWAPCRVDCTADARLEVTPIQRGRAHRMGQLFRAEGLARVEPGAGVVEPSGIVEWIPCASL